MKQIQCRYVFLSHCSCVKKMKKTLFFPSLKSRFFVDMTKQLTRSFWRNQTREFWGVAKPKTLIELGQLVGSGEHQGVVVRGEPLLYTPSTKILKLTCKLMNISTTSWNAYGTLDWWDLMGYFPLEQFGTGDSCPSTSFQMVGMLCFQGCLPTSPVSIRGFAGVTLDLLWPTKCWMATPSWPSWQMLTSWCPRCHSPRSPRDESSGIPKPQSWTPNKLRLCKVIFL